MEKIIAEIMIIIKGAANGIEWEERLRHYFEELACCAVSEAFERIDVELAAVKSMEGWRVERRDRRVVQATWGRIDIKRRLMVKDGEESIYPLDLELGIRKYHRYTPCFELTVAQIAAKSVYRTTAMAVNALTPVTISHQTVAKIVKDIGGRYGEWEKAQEDAVPEGGRKKVSVLYIEGDGLSVKGQGKGRKRTEVHRFQIAEGVREHGKRHELVGVHCVASESHAEARDEMQAYLASHYDLRETVVISNSDDGPGYDVRTFEDILGQPKRHEHFRDKYHVNRKIEERLGWAGKRLVADVRQAVSRHDWERVGKLLNSAPLEDAAQEEQVERLRAYLERGWPSLANMEERGLSGFAKAIGTCESNHRIYSYRMKKQGRSWGKAGCAGMVKAITGMRNGDLREALAAQEPAFQHETSKNLRYAVKNALKKGKWQEHEGVRHGRITVDAPSSSAIGQLSRCLAG